MDALGIPLGHLFDSAVWQCVITKQWLFAQYFPNLLKYLGKSYEWNIEISNLDSGP
jgi:hypothetical protein